MTEKKVPVPEKILETPGQKGKKRGQYKQKECPYCHVHVGNLGNHVKMKHPTETGAQPLELTKEKLLGSEVLPKKDTEITPVTYYCSDCKAEVRKGESNCWNCQAALLWDGIA
jgi:hypothetical protein